MSQSVGVQPVIVPHEEGVRSYRLDVAICVLALALIVLVWVAAFGITQREKEDAIASVIKSNANIARVVEEHTIRALDSADQTLRAVKREYEQRGAGFNLPVFYDGLHLDRAFHVNSVIANSAGDIVASSTRGYAPVNLADREHFRMHGAADGDKPIISKPILARVSNRWTIALTRRINRPDGSFGGIAAISMDPFYFIGLYQQIELGEKGIIALTGLDGIMRARLDTGKGNLGQDVSKSEVFRHIQKSPNGSYVAGSAVDGRSRIFSYRVVRGYPLLVNVGVAESVALAPVKARQRSYFIVAVSLSVLLLLGAGLLILTAHRRRSHAQALADGERRLQASRQLFLNQQTALTEIARDELLSMGELQPVFEKITQTAGTVMSIARVSVWGFSDDRKSLHCCDLYDLATQSHASGAKLNVSNFPGYFAALEARDVIAADDAHADARTREFSECYLAPLGITSMLDIPVFLGGELHGVICCEHVGAPLRWMPEQRLFGVALAHLVEIASSHTERRRVLAELARSEEIYRQTFLANPMPMWVRDSKTLAFLAVNDAALTGYGYSREEFLRMENRDIWPESDLPNMKDMVREENEAPDRTHTKIALHRRKDGALFDVQVISHPFSHLGREARLVLAYDITERQRGEEERRAREQEQRRVFIREIHHRIKNHIQGVAGLLQRYAREHAELAPVLRLVSLKLQSVAVVHGLKGAGDATVRLDEMVEAVCASLKSFALGRVTIEFRSTVCTAIIAEEEAVPLALIVNEMLMNAIKHTSVSDSVQAVNVEVLARKEGVCVSIRNRGRLPKRHHVSGEIGDGHGLSILRALLPHEGAVFSLEQLGESVCVTLDLHAPAVVQMDVMKHAFRLVPKEIMRRDAMA